MGISELLNEYESERKQTIHHQASMGGESVSCSGNPVFVGNLKTERGPLIMFVCPECLRVFLFADFDFNPKTGDLINE